MKPYRSRGGGDRFGQQFPSLGCRTRIRYCGFWGDDFDTFGARNSRSLPVDPAPCRERLFSRQRFPDLLDRMWH